MTRPLCANSVRSRRIVTAETPVRRASAVTLTASVPFSARMIALWRSEARCRDSTFPSFSRFFWFVLVLLAWLARRWGTAARPASGFGRVSSTLPAPRPSEQFFAVSGRSSEMIVYILNDHTH